MRRADAIGIVVLGIAGATVLGAFWLSGAKVFDRQLGFPLDDAWIHVRFAQNLAGGEGFAFNPGQATAGSTAPLWVVVLATTSLVTREYVVTALALGVLSYLLLVFQTHLVARRSFNNIGAGLLAAVVVAVNVRVVWAAFSGMEIGLAAFLALAAAGWFAADEAERHGNRLPPDPDSIGNGSARSGGTAERVSTGRRRGQWRPWVTPILFGLASLARPEAHLLFALAVFLRIARGCRRDTPIGEFFRLVPYSMIIVYLIVIMPWHLFAHFSSGSVLPNTFWANFRGLATRIIPPGFHTHYLRWLLIRDHPWVYWFVPLGIGATVYWTARRADGGDDGGRPIPFAMALAQLASLWVVCYPVAARIILPLTRHHARYMIPMTPFHAILAVLGILATVQVLCHSVGKIRGGIADPNRFVQTQVLWAILAAVVVLSAVPGLVRWSKVYGRNVYSINHQHVAMARWLRQATRPDAVVATHDIGAIGAISRRTVIDLFGLVTPTMIHKVDHVIPTIGTPSMWYLERLQSSGATYLIGYPEWLPFMREAPGCFAELHHARLEEVDICGGADMVAYCIDRDRLADVLSRR